MLNITNKQTDKREIENMTFVSRTEAKPLVIIFFSSSSHFQDGFLKSMRQIFVDQKMSQPEYFETYR